jgi:hypothetical protein
MVNFCFLKVILAVLVKEACWIISDKLLEWKKRQNRGKEISSLLGAMLSSVSHLGYPGSLGIFQAHCECGGTRISGFQVTRN